ncbi:hypothetical protein D4R20_03105 [bacterium]|nr:MAG: hypothetical protein D4R20_03105 [bacterium]
MSKKKILFIGGSLNQTTMVHKVFTHLPEYEGYFSPYYCSGFLRLAQRTGMLNFSVLGGKFKLFTEKYLKQNKLNLDYEGKLHDYDLVVTSSDLIIPNNIKKKKIVLIQEGMTDPMHFVYKIVKFFHLPRWLASTATTGQSHAYAKFCVASEGYKNFFVNKSGCKAEKIVVTGIPNFDNCAEFFNNDFPHKDYALVCTSDARETFKIENREKFIHRAKELAGGRQIIFKLHPNEKWKRAAREIKKISPDALVFSNANTNHMVANCSILIVAYSSVVYLGLTLGKEVHSTRFDVNEIKELTPIQNGGTSAKNIAEVCRELLES